jgi:hypothetical protein
MARTFYTERDIEDLAKRGVKEIEANDDVYITDLAREKMEQLGIKARANLKSTAPPPPPSAAPGTTASPAHPAPTGGLSEAEKQQVIDKVRSGVIARLGPGVDTAMVDAIVRRVVGQL